MKYTEKELEFIHFAIDEYESNTQLARLFIDNFSSKRTLPSIIDKIRNVRKSTTPYDAKTLTKTNEYKNKKKRKTNATNRIHKCKHLHLSIYQA